MDIDVGEKAILEKAIYSSPFSFPFKKLNRNWDLYTKILQDADTLDFFSYEREASFNKVKEKIVFYAFLGLFSDRALSYGRKNIANYLNFPELAKESYSNFANPPAGGEAKQWTNLSSLKGENTHAFQAWVVYVQKD